MSNMTVRDQIEMRRSKVRIYVTYGAAFYVFFGSLILVLAFAVADAKNSDLALAKEVFTMVLPIATGIITYWFASRRPNEASSAHGEDGQHLDTGDGETTRAASMSTAATTAASGQPSTTG